MGRQIKQEQGPHIYRTERPFAYCTTMVGPSNTSPLSRMWNSGRYSNAALHAARRESFAKRFVPAPGGFDMIHGRRRYLVTAAEYGGAQAALDRILTTSGRRLNLSIIAGIATIMVVTTMRTQIEAIVPTGQHRLVGNLIGAAPFIAALVIGIGQEVAVHRLFGHLASTATQRTGRIPGVTEADLTADSLPVGLLATFLFVSVIGMLVWWLG